MDLKSGHIRSSSRSLGQITEIHCGHSRGDSSCPIHLNLGQQVFLMSHMSLKYGHMGNKLGL